jgi:hypothetical protein
LWPGLETAALRRAFAEGTIHHHPEVSLLPED